MPPEARLTSIRGTCSSNQSVGELLARRALKLCRALESSDGSAERRLVIWLGKGRRCERAPKRAGADVGVGGVCW